MYKGVKQFLDSYHAPFEKQKKAVKKAKVDLKERGETANKKAIEEETALIIAEWEEKQKMGEDAHVFIHQRDVKKYENIEIGEYKRYSEEINGGDLDAQEESNLEIGKVYFEKKIVSNHHHLIGYADKVEVTKDGWINIEDYKTWDKVYRSSSFIVENGFKVPPKLFYPPIAHIHDCNLQYATLQLSLYMYLLWTYNKKLKPGKLSVRHVILNEEGTIVDEQIIEVPYLRDEVRALLQNKKLSDG